MPSGFENLPISPDLVRKLRDRGIEEPTPIQQQAIPIAAEGRDILAQSQTGTGKTLAYLLPLLQKLDASAKQTQALVLVPTRELGMQILQETEKLTQGTGLLAQSLIGGAALSRQVDKLRLHPHVVIGTPGRVAELIKMRKLSMHYVKTIVVDEVDQVFDLGSKSEVEMALMSALRDRQIMFFSATLTDAIRSTARRWMNDPAELSANPGERASGTLEHLYFVVEERDRIDMLRRLVRHYNPRSAIVFINEVDDIAEVTAKIKHVGLSIEALYSEAGKQERAKVMNGFRDGRFQLLLATDIAARGIDIPDLTHVINLDLPADPDHYVHRAGRTGRMGRKGTVISLLTRRELYLIERFTKKLGVAFQPKELYAGGVINPGEKRARPERAVRAEGSAAGPTRGPGLRQGEAAPARADAPAQERAAGAGPGQPAAAQPAAAARPTASPRPAASPRPSAAARPAAAGRNAPAQAAGAKSKSDRQRDSKNKGAPRWLKDKPQKDR